MRNYTRKHKSGGGLGKFFRECYEGVCRLVKRRGASAKVAPYSNSPNGKIHNYRRSAKVAPYSNNPNGNTHNYRRTAKVAPYSNSPNDIVNSSNVNFDIDNERSLGRKRKGGSRKNKKRRTYRR